VLMERRGPPPLMLLDDVMSELDPDRRELLADSVLGAGQALITATHPGQVPDREHSELRVRAGRIDAAGRVRRAREAA
jgi:DNA replication and repair protein RecF